MKNELIYVHDPMCSWCWGFRNTFNQLKQRLDGELPIRYLLGGLAPDSDQPMPQAMQQQLADTWLRIQQRIPNTDFNHAFWTDCSPRRSTYPACRAVIAAKNIDNASEQNMILAIQKAYYLNAKNPSDDETLITLANEIGLDSGKFKRLLNDPQIQSQLENEIAETRKIHATSFPSLVLKLGDSYWPVAIDYNSAANIADTIQELRAFA